MISNISPWPRPHSLSFFAITAALVATVLCSNSVIAQQALNWSPPQQIPGYQPHVLPPYMVADQNRTVHAFTSDWIGDDPQDANRQLAIVYSTWELEEGWSTPIDILLPSQGQARIKGAFLSKDGMIHLIYFDGDDLNAAIYYIRAPAIVAGRALAWSKPILIGHGAIVPDEATLVGDSQGNLVVVYSGNLEGQGLYAVRSQDSGDSWSDTAPIFLTFSSQRWPTALEAMVDDRVNIHLVWSVANTTGNSEAVYHILLDSEQVTWSEPTVLAEAIGYEADTPAIIEHATELIVVYHNDLPTTRWMRRSADGGITWTPPLRLFPHVGSNGPASLVVDSNYTLHMIFGNRVGDHPAIHGMWHSIWDGNQWRTPTALVSGDRVLDELGGSGFDPSFARTVVSQGNVLLVTWRTDPGAGPNGIWYSYSVVDGPELPVVPLPAPAIPPATVIQTPTSPDTDAAVLPTAVPVRTVSPELSEIIPMPAGNPASPLVVGVVPAFFLIMLIVVARQWSTRRKR